MKEFEGLKQRHGFWFPAYDARCWRFTFKQTSQFQAGVRACKKRDVAVQAGGNVGVWPDWLGRRFTRVYTFEPDPLNFRCLALNCRGENVVKFEAALGDTRETVKVRRGDWKGEPNCGGNAISGSGPIPVLRVDDLGLGACDFLQLDIEGYEIMALRGAQNTILEHKPVVMIEDKGHSKRFGVPSGEARAFLDGLGMVLKAHVGPDYIYGWPQ